MSTLSNRKDLNYHPKVLIIDIDETNAKLIAEILESENYRVQITINCQKSFSACPTTPTRPDYIRFHDTEL